MDGTLLAAGMGLLGALVGSALSYLAIRRKVRLELMSHFRRELHTARLVAYQTLWQATEPLALYAPPEDVTLEALSRLEQNLRTQYFQHGIFLSTISRDRYFLLQDALKIIIKGWSTRPDSKPLRSQSDRFTLTEAKCEEAAISRHLGLDTQPGKGNKPAIRQEDEAKRQLAEKLAAWKPGDGLRDFHLLRMLGSQLRSQLAHDLETRDATWAGLDLQS